MSAITRMHVVLAQLALLDPYAYYYLIVSDTCPEDD